MNDAPERPSAWRAWWALVWLSLVRQAQARQMVVLAVGLVIVATLVVGFCTLLGIWDVARWQWPPRSEVPLAQSNDGLQATIALAHPNAGGQSVGAATLGAFRAVVTPGLVEGKQSPAMRIGFRRFSHAVVFLVFLSFLLPLLSLSFATESFGGDRESGGMIWLLTRPIPRPAAYLARFVALLPWAIGLNLGGFALICVPAGAPGRLALSLYWPAVLWATLAFSSLFLLIGAYFRRPAIVALVYSFCLEMVLGNLPGYMKRVSISFYARCLMFEQASEYEIEPANPLVFLPVDGMVALTVLIGAAVALLLLGMWVFSTAEYHEVD
jgi:hypothetical protein